MSFKYSFINIPEAIVKLVGEYFVVYEATGDYKIIDNLNLKR